MQVYVDLATKSIDRCVEKQAKYRHTIAVLVDEISMWGQLLMGHTSRRADEIFQDGHYASTIPADGRPRIGGIPAFIAFGDNKQLAPVKDTPLYSSAVSDNLLKNYGKQTYDTYPVLYTGPASAAERRR